MLLRMLHMQQVKSFTFLPGQDDLIGYQQPKEKGGDMSPLEALRLQLRTLDELEEQFPACSVTDAYLRYPFSETGIISIALLVTSHIFVHFIQIFIELLPLYR